MKNEVIDLVVIIKKPDKDGFAGEERIVANDIMAKIKSVKRSEFYQAARDRMNLQLVAEINRDDFEVAAVMNDGVKIKPTRVRYDGCEYKIARTYNTSDVDMELTLQEDE